MYEEILAGIKKQKRKQMLMRKKHSKDNHEQVKEKGQEKDKEKVTTREQHEPREAETKQVEEAEQEDQKIAQKMKKPEKAHKGEVLQEKKRQRTTIKDKFIEYFGSKFAIEDKQH